MVPFIHGRVIVLPVCIFFLKEPQSSGNIVGISVHLINAITVSDLNLFLHLNDFTMNLQCLKVFFWKKAYYHSHYIIENLPLMAIITLFGLLKYLKMLFSLCNEDQSFQSIIDNVLPFLSFCSDIYNRVLIERWHPVWHLEYSYIELDNFYKESSLNIAVSFAVLV